MWSQFSFFQVKNGCVMAGIISLTGRSPLHLALRVLADRADSGDMFFSDVDQKEIRRLDENDYQGTGDRGGGISVPVFGMELVSLQSWI